MGKWFDQAREIDRLRRENQRLATTVAQLVARLDDDEIRAATGSENDFGVSAEERQLAVSGRKVEAIKEYRARTGADLITAKTAIDSVA